MPSRPIAGLKNIIGLPGIPMPLLSEPGNGTVWYDDITGLFYQSTNGGAYVPIGGGGVSDLQGAYDGGPGIIENASGPITITKPVVDATPALTISVTGGTGPAIRKTGYDEWMGLGVAPALSAPNTGRIYYDSAVNTFLVSQNGGAYFNLVPAAQNLASVLIAGNNTGALPINISNAASGVTSAAGVPINIVSNNSQIELDSNQAAIDAIKIIASNATGGIDIDSGTAGIDVDSTGRIGLDSFFAGGNSVYLTASNVAGGIGITSGTGGIISVTTGQALLQSSQALADAVRIYATDLVAGGVDIDAGRQVNIACSFAADDAIVLNSTAGGVDINGAMQINIDSSEATADAVRIVASNAAGGLDVDAGAAGIDVDTTGQINLDSSLAGGGAIRINASGAGGVIDIDALGTIDIATNGAGSRVNIGGNGAAGGVDIDADTGGIRLQAVGGVGGQILLQSSQAAGSAIRVLASDATGGIDIDAGTNGIDVDTTGQINLASTQAAADSIRIFATNAAGGIDVDSGTGGASLNTTGRMTLQSSQAAINAVRINSPNGGIDVDASLEISMYTPGPGYFVATGIGSDLTLGARSTTITLNQAGNTTLAGFTATSIIGALNELKGSPSANIYTNGGALMAQGEVAYITAVTDTIGKADATAPVGLPQNGIGFVVPTAGIANGATGQIQTTGVCQALLIAGLVGVTSGLEVFLSKTAGRITTSVAGFAGGDVKRSLGFIKDPQGYAGAEQLVEIQIWHGPVINT